MSDFEQWWNASKYMQVVFSNEKTKRVALDGWQAAKQSMQGEAKPVGNDLVERLKNSNTCYNWINRQNQEAAAEIARLTKELEEARKDAERYRHLREWFTSVHSNYDVDYPDGEYAKAVLNFEYEDVEDDKELSLDTSVDDAIRQIGGVE